MKLHFGQQVHLIGIRLNVAVPIFIQHLDFAAVHLLDGVIKCVDAGFKNALSGDPFSVVF